MDDLLIDLSHRGGEAVLTLCGEIDLASAPQLTESLQQLQGSGEAIVLDMSGVTFMDSAGIHALMDASRPTDGCPATIRIHNPSDAVRQLLEITGLTTVFAPES